MTNKFFYIQEIIGFELGNYLLNIIVFLLVVISIKLIMVKSLLEAVITMSIFSLLITLSYLVMDGADVAMTEVAINGCLSICVYLAFLQKLPKEETNKIARNKTIIASIICLIFIVTISYMGYELPNYGDSNSPLQFNISKYYIENTGKEIGTLSLVAGLLASYRGYDTLGETTVILIAGISVLLILSKENKHVKE